MNDALSVCVRGVRAAVFEIGALAAGLETTEHDFHGTEITHLKGGAACGQLKE
jgi:hypothetical protein